MELLGTNYTQKPIFVAIGTTRVPVKNGRRHCYLLCGEVEQLDFTGSFCIWPSRRPDKAAAQRAGVDAPLPEGCGFKAHIRRKNQAVGESD